MKGFLQTLEFLLIHMLLITIFVLVNYQEPESFSHFFICAFSWFVNLIITFLAQMLLHSFFLQPDSLALRSTLITIAGYELAFFWLSGKSLHQGLFYWITGQACLVVAIIPLCLWVSASAYVGMRYLYFRHRDKEE